MGFKRFIQKMVGDEDTKDILNENAQLVRKRKITQKEYLSLSDDYDDLQKNYIALLEEKSEKFDRYLHYHDLCMEQQGQIKELKKERGDLTSKIIEQGKEFEKYINDIKSYLPKLQDSKNKGEFYDNIKLYMYTNVEPPMKTIKSLCKKFKITKTLIKENNEEIYEKLQVKTWEIDE